MAERKPRGLSPVRRRRPEPAGPREAPERRPATAAEQKLNQYRKRRYQVLHQETEAAVGRRAQGKADARERVDALLDPGSFVELDMFATARAAYADIFLRNVRSSGVIPQLSVIAGPCTGGAAYSPALTDFVFTVAGSGYMFITGPEVVRVTTGEEVTFEQLGGGEGHNTRSGVAHFLPEDEAECWKGVRRLLSYLPSSNAEAPPFRLTDDDVERADQELQTL